MSTSGKLELHNKKFWLTKMPISFFSLIIFIPLVSTAALVDFEGGTDSVAINVSEPGIQFTTTDGQDWIYGDWRTGQYNGPYPNGAYYSFGNFFAWLGPNQGFGRIDFDLDVAERVRVNYSSFSTVYVEGYDAEGNLLVSNSGGGNLYTGSTGVLELEQTGIAYLLFHDTGNFWLIDNLDFELADVKLLEVDLQEDTNEAHHHTDKYDDPIVFRRGDAVNLNVVLTPGYQEPYYELELQIKDSEGATVTATPGNVVDATEWHVEFGEPQPKSWLSSFPFDDYVVVPTKVFIPFDLPIGKYEYSVKLQRQNGVGTPELLAAENPAYIIFNPWSTLDDDVYNSAFNDFAISEYVLREDGTIFIGKNASGSKSWQYDQFNEAIFLTTIDLVNKLPASERADAWRIARYLSAITNVQDDGGVLVGNWSGNYSDGKAPTYWSGSKQIFDQYSSAGSVQFGQCWVFAGVLNSMSRALGIPTRVITNAPSAHDTVPLDGVIVVYLDSPANSELIWNYHAWNEAWLSRTDRGSFSEAAWQAFDGTPQEKSDSIYRIGPAPVAAVKADASGWFDVDFIRYAVQADVEHRLYSSLQLLNISPFRSETTRTLNISTGGVLDRLNDYCSDCFTTSSIKTLWPWLYAGLQKVYSFFPGIFVRSASAASQMELHQVNVIVNEAVTLGGQVNGDIEITNTGSVTDTVTVLIFLYAQSSNGQTIAQWGQTSITDQNIEAGQTISLPLDFSVPMSDKILPGFDFYSVQVAAVGQNGTGAGVTNGVITGATVDVSATLPDANGVSIVTGTVNNLLFQPMTDVSLTLDTPSEVTLFSQRTVDMGNIPVGQSASASWTVELPPGSHNFIVEATAADLAPIHSNVVVSRLGAAKVSIMIQAPDSIGLGAVSTAQIEVQNTGGETADVATVATLANGLGGGQQVFQVNDLQPGESQTGSIAIQGMTVGQHGIAVMADTSSVSSQVTKHATTVVTVQGSQITASIGIDPDTINAGFQGDLDLIVNTDAGTEALVKIIATSDANKRYAIFDGTDRILAQSVMVPIGEKTLILRIEDAPTGGRIRLTATPIDNPLGSDTTFLNIVGQPTQSVVADRVSVVYGAVRYNRRTGEFMVPVTLTNISDQDLAGPVWLVISSLSPSGATLTSADGNTSDGRPYMEVLPEGTLWQQGQSLSQTILRIHNTVREPLSFEEQVLAIIP